MTMSSSSRRDLVPYGAAVLGEVLRQGKFQSVVFSALGVREGYLYGLLPEDEKAVDPLLQGAEEISVLRSRSPAHAEDLIAFTGGFLEAIGVARRPRRARLRTVACYLARYRLARASGLSRRAERGPRGVWLAHRREPFGPGVPRRGAGGAVHGAQAQERQPVAADAGGACGEDEGAAAGGDFPGGLPDVGGDAGACCRGRGSRSTTGRLKLHLPGDSRFPRRASIWRGGWISLPAWRGSRASRSSPS